jgi:hypothetical protein
MIRTIRGSAWLFAILFFLAIESNSPGAQCAATHKGVMDLNSPSIPNGTVYFYDDFESGLGNWIVSGLDWDTTTSTSRSSSHSLTDSPVGNYLPNSNCSATLADPLDLSGAADPVLVFWHKGSMSCCNDYLYVDVSTDGGTNWTEVHHYGSPYAPIQQSTWSQEQFDLGDWKSSSVKVRFRLGSDGGGDVDDGWYIDDVRIEMIDFISPTVTVLFPNGGELLETGDTVSIDWTASDNCWVDSVSISYSEDAGVTYELIAHGWLSDSSYAWIVPSSLSDSCLVRVVAYDPGFLTGFDTSDALFKIRDYTDVHDKGDGEGKPTPRYVTALEQNYPNPFNGTTSVSYSIAVSGRVDLKIYDPAGRAVRVLERRDREPGRYTALWNGKDDAGRDVASGLFFCRLRAGKLSQTMKIVYLR